MPATFSASTCITSSVTSPGPFDIYLDSDYTSTPHITNVSINSLTGNSCPYIIVVPTGTTSLGFKDILLDSCTTILIQDNNICSNCNLGLSNYSASTITRLSCGVLTGTCLNINDYVINWYGPNDTTTLAFTSGAGSFLTLGMTPHPFIGINSIPQPEGVYTPVISKIKLSGVTFSNTGGTNNVLFSGNCLPTTTILPLSCSNQTNYSTTAPYSSYKHYINYEFLNGNIPTPVNLTYKVSTSTEFFAWRFRGLDNPDRITIKFSGSSYGGDEFGLEDFVVGGNLTLNNFNPTVFPKSAQTLGYLTKLTCLTGLTVNNDDNILITITPATSNTVWDLYSTCLTSYDCTSCILTNPYKIIGSTITGITSSCFSQVQFSISGCNNNDYVNSDLYKYYISDGYQRTLTDVPSGPGSGLSQAYQNPINYYSINFINNQTVCNQGPVNNTITSTCATDTNNIKYEKTFLGGVGSKGVFNITGSSTVISAHYNSWNYLKTNFPGSSSSTDASYYRRIFGKFPGPTTSNNCLESVTIQQHFFHPSSTASTGLTSSGNYYFRLTAETISNNFSALTSCDLNCLSISNSYVNSINDTSTGATPEFNREFIYIPNTLDFGVYYTNPFWQCYSMTKNIQTVTGTTIGAKLLTNRWTTNTIPYSGVSNTFLPSLSGTVCNYNLSGKTISEYNSFYNERALYQYYIKAPTLTDFEIWSAPIINYSADTNPNNAILAYRYSGGSVTYSSSTYIIG